jgi:formyltetrahydrofolate-dependent phosphoribosylglycinamide formyltransferase
MVFSGRRFVFCQRMLQYRKLTLSKHRSYGEIDSGVARIMSEAAPAVSVPIAVLVSGTGRGSNLKALLDAASQPGFPGHIAVVIGTRSDAPALERAREHNIPCVVISPKKYPEESAYAEIILRFLRQYQVELVCLAGYMLRLPPAVVESYPQRVMNIHPALLPLFGGRGMFGENVHRAVLESGMKVSGCTVHFVDYEYDTGPIIAQSAVPVFDEDTPSSLAARVLIEEHRLYPRAVDDFCSGRLRVEGRRVFSKSNSSEE